MPQELPDIPRPFDVPDTTVNSVISSVAQFVLPFSVAGKAMSAAKFGSNVAASFPKAMNVVRPMIQGAIADFSAFDAHEKRLSNLIQNVPVLRNPVTEYLSAEDTDGQLEGRFKNAVEGLGLGALTDAFVKGVKAVRAARIAKTKAKAEGVKAVEDMFVPKINKEELSALGDVDADIIGKKSDLEKLKMKRDFIAEVSKESGFTDVSFGKLSAKYKDKLNFIRREDGVPLIENDELIIPANVVKKFHEKRMLKDKMTADQVADLLIDVFHKDGNIVSRTKKEHIQAIADIAPNKKNIGMGFIGINPKNGETVIKSVYRKDVERVIKDFTDIKKALDERGISSYEAVKNPPAAPLSVVNADNNIAKAAGYVNDDSVYINFARIDAPEDIKKVMDELAQMNAKDINKTRRGKMTFDKIKLNAEQEDAFKVLTERRAGGVCVGNGGDVRRSGVG